METPSNTEGWGDWGDDEFSTTLDTPGLQPASSYAWDENQGEGDFFSSLTNVKKKVFHNILILIIIHQYPCDIID